MRCCAIAGFTLFFFNCKAGQPDARCDAGRKAEEGYGRTKLCHGYISRNWSGIGGPRWHIGELSAETFLFNVEIFMLVIVICNTNLF